MDKHTGYETAKTAIHGIYGITGKPLRKEARKFDDEMFEMAGCTGTCNAIDEHQYAAMYTAFRVTELGCSPVPFAANWEHSRVMSAWNHKGCFEVENVPD